MFTPSNPVDLPGTIPSIPRSSTSSSSLPLLLPPLSTMGTSRRLSGQASRSSLRRRASDTSTGTSASLKEVLAENQRLAMLESMDKLAWHLPLCVLNQLVNQVIHQENEQQVLNMLGKSIPIHKLGPQQASTSATACEAPKRGPQRTKSQPKSQTLPPRTTKESKKKQTCLIGMTLDDSNHTRDSDTSSIAEDQSWAHLLEDTSDEDSSLNGDDDDDDDDDNDNDSFHSPSIQDTLEASMRRRRHSAKSLPLLEEEEEDYPDQNNHQEVARMRHGRLSSINSCNNMHNSMATLKRSMTTPQASAHIQATTRRLGSTRHTSALLFVDISGFVTMSRSLDVESLSKVRWFPNRLQMSLSRGCLTLAPSFVWRTGHQLVLSKDC
jgi:hypothetical protein